MIYRTIKNKNSNVEVMKGNNLIHNFILGIKSMLIDYNEIYTKDEQQLLYNYLKKLEFYEQNKNNLSLEEQISQLNIFFKLEEDLKKIVIKSWKLGNDYHIISWLKDDIYRDDKKIISAVVTSIDNLTQFCDSYIGIEYEFSEESFLGAASSDAAVVVNSSNDVYTIGFDDYFIESYNMATSVITPVQMLKDVENYNEIILLAKKAHPINVICLNEIVLKNAQELANKLHVEVKVLESKNKII